jgi:hypothetical protein
MEMIIVTEEKMARHESGDSEWDITWKAALDAFKAISANNGITFFEVGPDIPPLGKQPITGLKVSGNDLYIIGKQTGYIVFGSQVKRVVRRHFGSSRLERITLLFSAYKELEINWHG